MADPVSIFTNIAIAAATSAISSALAPTQKFEGPRLDELRVQTSTYGKFRPIPFGTIAYAGNVFWLENNKIKETKHKESTGKGGPKTETTTYTYSATFAVGLGEGPIGGILRIWADSVLIYDGSSTDPEAVYESGSLFESVTIYLGDETQYPNARMEAADTETPAYRGESYILFEDFQLEKFGNRIPNITAEVVADDLTLQPARLAEYTLGGTARTYGASALYFDEGAAELILFHNQGGLYAAQPVDVYRVQLNGTKIKVRSFDPENYGAHIDGWADNPVFVTSDSSGKITVQNSLGINVHQCDGCGTSNADEYAQYYQRGQYKWLLHESITTSTVYNVTGLQAVSLYVSNASTPTGKLHTIFPMDGVIFGFTLSGQVVCFDYTWDVLWSVDMSPESITVVSAIGGNDVILRATNSSEVLVYWARKFWKASESGYQYMGTVSGIAGYEEHGGHHWVNGVFAYYRAWDNKYELLNIESGAVVDSTLLTTLTARLANYAGIATDDIDTTSLTGQTVDGYVITNLGKLRSSIEPLQITHQFDVLESDYKLKFVKRGGSSVASLTEEDLAAHEFGQERSDELPGVRGKESELPRETKLTYISSARDYESDTQSASRLVTESEQINEINLPIVLSDDKAAQIAEIAQTVAWIERNTYPEFSLPYKYSYLEPSDVITVNLRGITHKIRITQTDLGNPGILKCSGVAEKTAHYTSAATGIAGQSSNQTLGLSGPTNLVLLDIPILRDQDNDSGFYAAAGGYYSGWPGGVLMKSVDGGQSYTQAASFVNETTIGYLTATPTTGSYAVIDTDNTINVKLFNSNTLSSVTEIAMLNGANAAAIGADGRWVIIKFQTATLEGDGSYTLSNIIWGYKGTEYNLSSLASGDTFVLLSSASMIRTAANDDEIGSERHYKAVTFGKNIATASEVAFTNNAESLEPYAPTHIVGVRDGSSNLTVTWHRRTRLGGEWRDLVGASLSEDSEAYEIDFTVGGTTVTKTGITSETYSYTAAEQTTDFGAAQSSIITNIYQVSATTGRGHAGTETL